MAVIHIYSKYSNNRLCYVLDWLFVERLGVDYTLSAPGTPPDPDAGLTLAYGVDIAADINIPENGLLAKTGIEQLNPEDTAGSWGPLPVLFSLPRQTGLPDQTNLPDATRLPFDLFAAVFYLLSRYEEYLPYTPDKHDRYNATDSVLYRLGWLQRPIVDEWVQELATILQGEYNLHLRRPDFRYQPTYDIDIAYSHAYKGIKRITGAYLRALLKGDLEQIAERTRVLKKKSRDPYDAFGWMKQQHELHHYYPIYFVLCSLQTTAFDKNIHPRHPAMVRVIRQLAREGITGIHPSYYATTDSRILEEKELLEATIGQKVLCSRQHYIRFKLPDTCRLLMACGIMDDFSMGYATHSGFRAGTGAPFFWFDLDNDEVCSLRLNPFCFMDSSALYEQKLTHAQAFGQLQQMAELLQRCRSTLVTVFHNFSLGTADEWDGWNAAYGDFLEAMAMAQKKAIAQ